MTSSIYHKTEEHKKKISKTLKQKYQDPEFKRKMYEAQNSPEATKKRSNSLIEHFNLPGIRDEARLRNKKSHSSLEFRKKVSRNSKKTWSNLKIRKKSSKTHKIVMNYKEVKDKLAKTVKKLYQNPEFKERMLKSRCNSYNKRPNKFEKNFLKYCLNIGLTNISYVGNAEFWLTVPKKFQKTAQAINPDFILTPFSKTKTVIETMGTYWHSKSNIIERKLMYQELGIRCIVITDNEFYNHQNLVYDKIKPILEF